jgi:hypothetical protein
MAFADIPTLINEPLASNYHLKAWNEADGLALIRLMNQTAYDVDIPTAGDFRGNFLTYQGAVNLAAREFLLRYPNSVDREQVEWLLASTNTLDRRDSDEWLVAQITERINKGWLDPADLNSGLEPLGFLAYPAYTSEEPYRFDQELPLKPVMNLFGDEARAYIWQIQSTEESYYGHKMYLAVEQLTDGLFRVARIYSKHNFPFGGGPEMEVRDLTGDGQPELIISDVGCEFGCNIMNVYIYQWQVDRFIDLSRGNFGSEGDSGGDFTWEYDDKNQTGSTVINVTHSFILEPDLHRKLIWNGEWFQIAEMQIELPGTEYLAYDRYEGWIGYAMEFAEFDGIEPLFEYLLENPPKEQGPAFPDFIRFQMAMVKALSSHVRSAREQLQGIIDSPTDPTKPLVASAAAAFLADYQGDANIYRSCQAALLVMDRSLKALTNTNSQPTPEEINGSWGFLPVNSLCNPRAAFRLLLSSLNLESGADVTDRLRQAGVPVLRSLKADFDGDGLDDWLVVVNTPASERTVETWIFVDTGQEYSAIPVFDYDTRFPGYAVGSSNEPVRVDSFPFPGDRQPAIVLQAGGQLTIFTVHHKDLTTEIELLLTKNKVQSFQVDPQTSVIRVTYIPGAYDTYYDIYAWREGLYKFLYLSQVDLLLFEQSDPAEAILAIKLVLSNMDIESYDYSVNASRLYYMLGLAYELQDNPPAAVEAYLKVWREFPGSPYALMAREKIQ